MGTTETRCWDARTFTSRPALASDPADALFEAYVPHPISDWEPHLSMSAWGRVASATERCQGLAQRSSVAAQADAAWLLDRAESIASSTIEGIRPAARRVARAEAQLNLFGESPPSTEMEALRNISATQHACELAEGGVPLSVAGICDIHHALMGDDDPIAGRLRDRQNWITSRSMGGPLDASYVAPPPDRVPALMEDLAAYVNDAGGSPLVRAAVAHAQFEMIHPFADGNGRTGRALVQYMFLREGLSPSGALPVSSALMISRDRYFDALDAAKVLCDRDDSARSSAFGPLVDLLCEAVKHACVLRERLTDHISALSSRWAAVAKNNRVRPSSAADRLLGVLPQHPVVTAESVMRLLGVDRSTAHRAVNRLAALGILSQRSAGRRNRVFECADLMDAFTEAARSQPPESLPFLPAADGEAPSPAQGACGAETAKGKPCAHPQPPEGRPCQAGHLRHS